MESDHPDHPSASTLELLFGLAVGSAEADLRAVDAIDSKIVQAFAAGAVLVGLPAAGHIQHDRWHLTPLVVAVCAFAYLGYQTIRGLWRRKFRAQMSPYQLWNSYCWDQPYVIKEAFVADAADAWRANNGHLRDKRRLLNRALIGLGVEALAIGAALLAGATS